MALYMDQEVFNALVFTSAWAKRLRGMPRSECDRILGGTISTYQKTFPLDEFEPEVNKAEQILLSWLDNSFPNPAESEAWLSKFLLASKEWQPNGKRKTKTIFNGTWFSAPHSKPIDRAGQFVRDLMLYFANISSGQISPSGL